MQDLRSGSRTATVSRSTKRIVVALVLIAVAAVIVVSSISGTHHDKTVKAGADRWSAVFTACAQSPKAVGLCEQAAAHAQADKTGAYERAFLSQLCAGGVADGCDQLAKLPRS